MNIGDKQAFTPDSLRPQTVEAAAMCRNFRAIAGYPGRASKCVRQITRAILL